MVKIEIDAPHELYHRFLRWQTLYNDYCKATTQTECRICGGKLLNCECLQKEAVILLFRILCFSRKMNWEEENSYYLTPEQMGILLDTFFESKTLNLQAISKAAQKKMNEYNLPQIDEILIEKTLANWILKHRDLVRETHKLLPRDGLYL